MAPPTEDEADNKMLAVEANKKLSDQTAANKQAKETNPDYMPYMDYRPQLENEVLQLDTDEDKTAVMPMAHIIKKVREVYGQQPTDMLFLDKQLKSFWDKLGVAMNSKDRPSPYRFPAFEKQVLDMKKYKDTEGSKVTGKGYKGGRESLVSNDASGYGMKPGAGSDLLSGSMMGMDDAPGSMMGMDDDALQKEMDDDALLAASLDSHGPMIGSSRD